MNSKLVVVPVQKSNKNEGGFIIPETVTNLGLVRHSDQTTDYPVGTKVYYGNEFFKLHMENEEVRIMDSSNVIAIVEE
jgi:co-chaperonin GroES (HSP10)